MLYTGDVDGERTPMEDAEAQLYRRIQELRARARGLEGEDHPSAESSEAPADLLITLLVQIVQADGLSLPGGEAAECHP